jgi:YidC/Oxa1 family membrane protein insertase
VKEDQKNFVLFAVIAGLLLFAWPYATSWLFPQPPAQTKMVNGKQVPMPTPTAEAPAVLRDRAAVLAETPRVAIETPAYKGSINLKGARIDDLVLVNYDETTAKNSPQVHLLSPSGTQGAYFAEFGWAGAGVQAPGANTVWQASGTKLTPTTPVTLTSKTATGQVFRIDLSVDADYMFSIRQTVANLGQAPIVVTPYASVSRAERSKDAGQWAARVGPIAQAGNESHYLGWKDVETTPLTYKTAGGWTGFTDHYWLTTLIPDQRVPVTLGQRQNPSKAYQADYQLDQPLTIAPGKQSSYSSHFFAGAKEVKTLEGYQAKLGIVQFSRAIDWGWFELVEKPIFYYLDWLFRLVGNFGVAIILLTLTIRGLLFPIAHKQFESMARMRVVQPKMKALQERYKDDKQRQQQEIMKLYKEEKVNPLAGCLPILLQIPIMFALYKVLLLTIEMRHQPFVLWIRDLSAPDPATILNLFGYLHFTPPSFLAIGVVPVLLGVSMYFQMKFNPAPMDEVQKQVFAIMPWMLMFLMAPFAVGLQVYWITSNCITILQQQWLYSRHPVLKQSLKKEAPAK